MGKKEHASPVGCVLCKELIVCCGGTRSSASPDEAVKVIQSGDWVDYGLGAIHPRVLDEALARRAPELTNVKVRGGICLWKPAIFSIENPAEHIIWNSHHMSGIERHYLNSGACFHIPMRYSELPIYYESNEPSPWSSGR